MFGKQNPVQRCRRHKIENAMGYLPNHLKDQVRAAMRAADRLRAEEAMVRLNKQAEWLEREYPTAAVSLREGLAEMFTVNRLGVPQGAGSVPVVDQHHRESQQWNAPAHAASLWLARRKHGAALGGGRPLDDRKAISQDHGLPGSVDAEGCSGGKLRELYTIVTK